ncbi:MAG: tol-pal system protein YbgF [Deltaproteobacteria bacterium]|nr:tol-pal system protein YbgF [Deltaproteobacteria bacterium]
MWSCGGSRQILLEKELEDLQNQLTQVQREQAKIREKTEELGHWMFLIQDRVDSNKVSLSRTKRPKLPKLKVVKLRPDTTATQVTKTPASTPIVNIPAQEKTDFPPNQGNSSPESTATSYRNLKNTVPVDINNESLTSPGKNAVEKYQQALSLFRKGEINQAILAFSRFFEKFKNSDLADNALYWTGEAYYDQKEYALALEEFRRVIEDYPQGNKVPDALLKSALCMIELKKVVLARNALYQLVDLYPASDAAKTAQVILGKLGNSRAHGGGSHVPLEQ